MAVDARSTEAMPHNLVASISQRQGLQLPKRGGCIGLTQVGHEHRMLPSLQATRQRKGRKKANNQLFPFEKILISSPP